MWEAQEGGGSLKTEKRGPPLRAAVCGDRLHGEECPGPGENIPPTGREHTSHQERIYLPPGEDIPPPPRPAPRARSPLAGAHRLRDGPPLVAHRQHRARHKLHVCTRRKEGQQLHKIRG